jgi:uncharacterized damage-inducible protein DinB
VSENCLFCSLAESLVMNDHAIWTTAVSESVASYRRLIDAAVAQLSDAELFERPTPELNSVAVILRHLGGNLRSRWTDYLTTDGEKPDRDREQEFADWEGTRESLMEHFEVGWQCLTAALEELSEESSTKTIRIRGEAHSVPQALSRTVTHIAYHAGQVTMIARQVHRGQWNWLTVAPGASELHNQQTWGTTASRSVFGEQASDPP